MKLWIILLATAFVGGCSSEPSLSGEQLLAAQSRCQGEARAALERCTSNDCRERLVQNMRTCRDDPMSIDPDTSNLAHNPTGASHHDPDRRKREAAPACQSEALSVFSKCKDETCKARAAEMDTKCREDPFGIDPDPENRSHVPDRDSRPPTSQL